MKNKAVWTGGIVGAILAIPFLFGLFFLEEGIYTNNDGICPYHKVESQMSLPPTPGDEDREAKTICENRIKRGIPEGEIRGGGFTCIDGIYYQTNYHCITKTIGFIESEAGGIIIVWIFLAEFYGIIFGGLIGSLIGFTIKKFGRKK
ncbi:hypothetical protein HYV50_04895 [Candidatus Pacearchaeota archaeon]|nr:hypothetical protein [Candidatus Pacearchaeota archaeon]